MDGSRAIVQPQCTKFASFVSAMVNRPNTTLPPGEVNFDIDVAPQPNLVIPSPRTRNVQAHPLRVPTSLLVKRPKVLHVFGIHEENINVKGANKFLNYIYNIVQQQNSREIEELFLRLK